MINDGNLSLQKKNVKLSKTDLEAKYIPEPWIYIMHVKYYHIIIPQKV